MEEKPRRPGDHLLNKYLPNADEETREMAREAFREYALLLIRIGTKIEEKLRLKGTSPSFTDEGTGVTISNI